MHYNKLLNSVKDNNKNKIESEFIKSILIYDIIKIICYINIEISNIIILLNMKFNLKHEALITNFLYDNINYLRRVVLLFLFT